MPQLIFDEPTQRMWIDCRMIRLRVDERVRFISALVERPGEVRTYDELAAKVSPNHHRYPDDIQQNIVRSLKEQIIRELHLSDQDEDNIDMYIPWENVQPRGYRLKEGWSVVPWAPGICPPMTWPPPENASEVDGWKRRFEKDEAGARLEIERLTNSISHSAGSVEDRVSTFMQILLGYTGFVYIKKGPYPYITSVITEFLQKLQPNQEARRVLEIMDYFSDWLQSQTCNIEANNLYSDLYKLCYACWDFDKMHGSDADEAVWFHRVFRAAAFLVKHDQVALKEITKLELWLRRTYRRFEGLRRLEYRALYLEQIEELWHSKRPEKSHLLLLEAGVESEEAALMASARRNNPWFAAALYVRAAECFRRIGKLNKAALAFSTAADLLAPSERLSKKAVEYYQEAIRLAPNTLDRKIIEGKIDHLEKELNILKNVSEATIVIISNSFDTAFADALLDPLSKQNIACLLKDSSKVQDLAEQTGYNGIIIIGGIHARSTGRLLRSYFYDTWPSNTKLPTFRVLDAHIAHYCGAWRRDIKGKPAVVLAGLTREETCQAVLQFIDGSKGFLQDFVRSVRK